MREHRGASRAEGRVRIWERRPARAVRRITDNIQPFAPISPRVYGLIGVVTLALILLLWIVVTYSGLIAPLFLPSPTKLAATVVQMYEEGSLLLDVWTSVYTIAMGFLIAAVLAIPLGILMGTVPGIEAAIDAPVGFIRYLPVTALIPLFILFIGIGIEAKVALIFYGTFFQLILMVADTAANVRKDLLETSFTLGVGRWTSIYRVVWPASLPSIMDSLRISFGWAWTYLVVAELLAANHGLGYMILQGMRGLRTDRIYVGILIIGVLGIICDRLFRMASSRLFPWSERVGR